MLAQADNGEGPSYTQIFSVIAALALLILPFVFGGVLAKSLKMPNYGTRFGWVLLAISASVVVLSLRWPGLGVDLRGGTILVYEIDSDKLSQVEKEGGQRIKSEDLIEPLTRRINPSGTEEIVLRPYGETQIEIIVPAVDQREVDRIKLLVEEAGILRFAILANQADHDLQIRQAIALSESERLGERTADTVRDAAGQVIAFWANVDREEMKDKSKGPMRVDVSGSLIRNPDTGQIINSAQFGGGNGEQRIADFIDREGISGIDTLMIVDPDLDITGEDLAFAASTFDQNGSPAVAFTLTDAGSSRFFELTSENAPKGSRQRQLGIVLDDNLLSAPNILQPIRKEGRITGRFTRAEVEQLVQILKAGQLPAALTKQPIAENQIDATLGADTIEKGVKAIGISLALVLVFIMVYYRFAGIMACIALAMNLGMILATMVVINQPLTLPGLAGLVLTVGMSVDANVLIFERIREELKKGAAARMAIRNGFGKATVTIIDANLTTLITAIVLYAIGTDQIRGFAVTLILGILFSMFTAIYVSRTLFDIAERHGFLSLGMSDGVNSIKSKFSGESGLDFIGKGKVTVAVSSILVLIGIASLFVRGKGILDIDFAGGSSVQFRIDQSVPSDEIRDLVKPVMLSNEKQEAVPYTVNGVSMQGVPENTVYKVDVSSELGNVDDLKAAITKAFGDATDINLVTFEVSVSPGGSSSLTPARNANGVMLTALQADPQEAESNSAEGDSGNTTPDEVESETEANEAGSDDNPVIISADEETQTRELTLRISGSEEVSSTSASINGVTLKELLISSAEEAQVPLTEQLITLTPLPVDADDEERLPNWKQESNLTFAKWKIEFTLSPADADAVMNVLKQRLDSDPIWISSSSVGARVAGDMIGRAFGALFASLLCIIGYIWFRFQRVLYGFAAVAALLHDVLITLGAIAVSYWLNDVFGFLKIDQFKISLTVVAAILTIIGYSLNDTIVVFDRIRETKGKAPRLTGDMINASINQTLSRTLLTSLTTLIVVVLLYWFGGAGIHAFAFALVVGVIAGTYSSVFIASPILLWLIQSGERKAAA
ncbi:MAG: protein translocase subunit SecD [Planctomycetota bacterium]